MTEKDIKLKRFAKEAILQTERKEIHLKDMKIISYDMEANEVIRVKVQDVSTEATYLCEINNCGFPAVSESDNPRARENFRKAYDHMMMKK